MLFVGLASAVSMAFALVRAGNRKRIRAQFVSLQDREQRLERLTAELGTTTAQLDAILDGVAGGIVTLDADRRIHNVNAAGARLLGQSAHALIGTPWRDVVDDPEVSADTDRLGLIQTAVVSGHDQRAVPVEIIFSRLGASADVPSVAVMRDVSARREVERMKNEFVGNVSHKLRTPLTSIHAALGLLALELGDDIRPKVATLVRVAEANSARLVALVGDLLDVQRLTEGQLPMTREPIAIADVLARACEAVAGMATLRSVRIEVDGPPASTMVFGDRRRLVQVVTNVVSNAIRFSPEHDTVSVRGDGRGRARPD